MSGNKYGARKTPCGEHIHDSAREAARCGDLRLMEKGGLIADLLNQPIFRIEVNGVHVCDYKADFSYWENGDTVIEDVKGVRTAVYRLKRKLMKAAHGIAIRET